MKHARQCNECGSGMNEGFVIGGGGEYYCNEECLHKNVTPQEWEELTEDEDSDCYWTQWEDEDDFLFEEDENGVLFEIEE